MPHHAPVASWTEHGYRRWFARCDMCRVRRLVGWYYECYPPRDEPVQGWWYACADCLVDAVYEMRAHENILVDTPEKAEAAAAAFMRATAGEHHDEVYGPCILDELGDALVAVDWLAADAEGLRDRLLAALTADEEPISLTGIGQDWCDAFEPGPDGTHCRTCRYPRVGHNDDQGGDDFSYREHRRACTFCNTVRVVNGDQPAPCSTCLRYHNAGHWP